MSSECVCHIDGVWCFYCEMYMPVVAENERLKKELWRERMWRKGWENTAKEAQEAVERLRTELKAESLRAAEWEGEALGYAEESERLRNLLLLIYQKARTDAVRRGGGQRYARRLVRELGSIISPEVV